MGEKTNKGFISEEDVSLLLQRYNPTIVLTLLHEVCQVAGPKIDWNALVKRTATGITSAREYQMLWRHLAYCHAMEEKIDDGAELLGDDSDLEFDLEVANGASDEALSDAATCVKALISSNLPREPGFPNRTIPGAPLTLTMSSDQASRVPPEKQHLFRTNRGNNNAFPVTGQKHQLPRVQSAEGLDGHGATGSDMPSKKKRKLWTKEEDNELIAAVQKYGEGNWVNILKGEFKHNRTASQLSQRWAIIRKKDGNLLAGSSSKPSGSVVHSEERLATQKAIFLALDMPGSGRLTSMLSGSTHSFTQASSSATSTALSDAIPCSASQSLNQLPQASTPGISQKVTLNQSNKARTTPTKPSVQVSPFGPNPSIKAAAFAAGGRIATPSTAYSLFKAAQSKNVVHIRPGVGVRVSSPSSIVTALPATSAGNVRANQSGNSAIAPSSLRNEIQPTPDLLGKLENANAENSSVAVNNQVPSEALSNPTLHDTAEGNIIDGVDSNDAYELTEEIKASKGLELDDMVAQNSRVVLPHMNSGINKSSNAESVANNRVVPSKPEVDANQNGDIKLVQADHETSDKKATGIASDGN